DREDSQREARWVYGLGRVRVSRPVPRNVQPPRSPRLGYVGQRGATWNGDRRVTELPKNGQLLALAKKHVTDQSLADELGVPRTTLRDHIYRIGMREQVNAVRDMDEVVRPAEIPVIRRDYSDQDRHYIYPLGDVHKG